MSFCIANGQFNYIGSVWHLTKTLNNQIRYCLLP